MKDKCRRSAAAMCCAAALLVARPALAQIEADSASAPAVSTAPGPSSISTLSTPPRQGGAVSRFFGATLTDLRQIPTKENLLILGIGAAAAAGAHPSDARVTGTMTRASSLGSAFAPGQTVGSVAAHMAGAIVVSVAGRASGNTRLAAVGSDLVRAQIVSQLVTQGIKFSVNRTRPDGTQYSFPSGHTATSFATATVLQRHYGWKAGIPAYAMATYVAASRVHEKRHFLSDVTMGAAIGIVAGRSVTVGRGDARFALAPAAVPGGGAVQFSWLGKQ